MKNSILTCLFSLAILFSLPLFAGDERHIHVNGEHLDITDIKLLDQLTGGQVDNGYYWLNMQTGQWGYEGNDQVQGTIESIAHYIQNQNSDRGQSGSFDQEAEQYNDWEGADQNGSVVSGRINGQNCTYVSVGGTTMRSCD
jgi:hypothetical protein